MEKKQLFSDKQILCLTTVFLISLIGLPIVYYNITGNSLSNISRFTEGFDNDFDEDGDRKPNCLAG